MDNEPENTTTTFINAVVNIAVMATVLFSGIVIGGISVNIHLQPQFDALQQEVRQS